MRAQLQNYSKSRVSRDYVPLAELLPLDTPLSIMVDPSNICNFRCAFCPTGDDELLAQVGRPKGMMTLDVFQPLIDSLDSFPSHIKVLHLYKDGEPLANKSLAEMIAYAKQSQKIDRVETTTNGLLLRPAKADELIAAGLDGIRISIYALNDTNYGEITRNSAAKFERIIENVSNIYASKSQKNPSLHVHCKITDTGLSQKEKDFFISTFSPISDSIHIDGLMGWSNTGNRDFTLGLVSDIGMSGEKRVENRKVCSEPFMKLAVNHNGDVSVCCVDWAHETVVGNITKETLFEIWNGKKLSEFRLKHLTGQRSSIKPCESCDYVLGLPQSCNLDHVVDFLLEASTNR